MNEIDWLLGLLYAAILYFLGSNKVSQNGSNPLYRQYYMRGLRYKFIGAFGFAMIYLYYYKGGDSINFFVAVSPLIKVAIRNPAEYIQFVFTPDANYPWSAVEEACRKGACYLLNGSASLTVIKIGSILNLVCFNSFLALTVVFAYLSYQFQFRMFSLLSSVYPKLTGQFAFAFLMIPSVIFWGSGFAKDTIMLSCILQFFYSFYHAVILKKNVAVHVVLLLVFGFLISLIRGFILFTVLPSLVLMAATYYRTAIQSSALRFFIGPVILIAAGLGSLLVVRNLGSAVQSYSLESLEQKAEGFRSWHTTQGGSTYFIEGDLEFTPVGILKKAPVAAIICLFGPFVWQIRNIVMLMSGVESLIFLYLFTTKVFFNRRLYSLFNVLIQDHVLMFCIPFVAILAVAIGLTSFNYGALVRYRIPILPFFACLFIITNYHLNRPANARA